MKRSIVFLTNCKSSTKKAKLFLSLQTFNLFLQSFMKKSLETMLSHKPILLCGPTLTTANTLSKA